MVIPHYAESTISSMLKTRLPPTMVGRRVSVSGKKPTPFSLHIKGKSPPSGVRFNDIQQERTMPLFRILLYLIKMFAHQLTTAFSVKKAAKMETCMACERSLPRTGFPQSPQGCRTQHGRNTCRECWHEWLEVQVANVMPDEIGCAQCSQILQHTDVKDLATAAVYENYVDAGFKALLSAYPDFRYCMSPGCKSGQIHSEGAIFRCVSCGFKTCVDCDVPWHEGETCGDYKLRKFSHPREEEQSTQKLKKCSKICPGCERRVQKDG